MTTGHNDNDALRARLDKTRGREYWRSLESLAETPEFKEFLHRGLPRHVASEAGHSRFQAPCSRDFQLLAAKQV